MIVHTARKGLAGVNQHQIETPVYVLFNPWCPSEFFATLFCVLVNQYFNSILEYLFFTDDGVHMNNEDELEEYVLNDNGKVWQGTFKEPKGYQWFFGQFEAVVLPSVMMLLDRASIPHQDRGQPVKMARCISAIVSNKFY